MSGPDLTWLQAVGVLFTPYAWLAHILIGVSMQAIAAGLLRLVRVSKPWWLGAAFSIGYAWSREKTEFEFILKDRAHANSLGAFWYRGFVPPEWTVRSQIEFYAPTMAVLLIAWMAERQAAGSRAGGSDRAGLSAVPTRPLGRGPTR